MSPEKVELVEALMDVVHRRDIDAPAGVTTSDPEWFSPWGGIYDFRDGNVSRIRTFFDHDEALHAADLAE